MAKKRIELAIKECEQHGLKHTAALLQEILNKHAGGKHEPK